VRSQVRAILFGSVPLNQKQIRNLKKNLKILDSDLIIGIDGGLQLALDFGFKPDLFVGDEDSLPKKSRKSLHAEMWVKLSCEKDRSDLYYATLKALELGATELVYISVTGGPRLDHHMATLFDLSQFAQGRFGRIKAIEVHGPEGGYYFLSHKIPVWKATLSPKSIVSVFAMTPEVLGLNLRGFKFRLKNYRLEPHSLGLSNQVMRQRCEIRIKKGVLLVVVPSLT
jgi:thiamine pyrophosphokinase